MFNYQESLCANARSGNLFTARDMQKPARSKGALTSCGLLHVARRE